MMVKRTCNISISKAGSETDEQDSRGKHH